MSEGAKLTDAEKTAWFRSQIDERQAAAPLQSEEEVIQFLRDCRRKFRKLYGRDVPGSFFRLLLKDCGVFREQSESIKRKRDFIFKLLDENQAYRDSKLQLRKRVESEFGERILGIVFDEIWTEYNEESDRPKPKQNVDLFGQDPLFD